MLAQPAQRLAALTVVQRVGAYRELRSDGTPEQVMLVLAARAGHALGAELSESAFAGALIAA